MRGSYTETNFSKNEIVTGETPFFVIGPLCTPILFALILVSERAVLYGNVSTLVLSTKKRYHNYFNLVRPVIPKNSVHSGKISDSNFLRGVFLLDICVL